MPKYGFRKRVGRVVRRVVRKGVKYAKKRYVNKKGNLRLNRLVKDVAMVKKLINVEKKRYTQTYTYDFLGQVNGAGGGAYIADLTPLIAQGTGASQRTGNSVKMTGMYLQGQLIQQQSAIDSNIVSVEVWFHKTKEVTMSLSSTGNEIYNNSPFSNQIDMISRRNQDYFSDYVCIRKKRVVVRADTYSATNILRNATFGMGLKLNRHLRWNDAGTLINGQLFLLVRCQSGNGSSTTASTANIPHQGINTGLKFSLDQITYYVDN